MLLLIVATIAMASIELPGLIKKKMWKELIAFWVVLSIGFWLSFIQVLRLPVTRPAVFLIETVKKYLPWYYQFMQP